MRKQIAIVTGASGGIGSEFVKLLAEKSLDEIWVVARNQKKLMALQATYGNKIRVFAEDLTQQKAWETIETLLIKEKPIIRMLINNAGIAKMGSCQEFTIEKIATTINLNCTAVAALCTICIPYMKAHSRILNIASASAFLPLPYLNLYAATKVFVRNYSRALHVELKSRGITVTAVCPGWVNTELLTKEINSQNVNFLGLVTAEKIVRQAYRDAQKGRDMSVCTLYVKLEHVLTKLFPQKIAMQAWLCQIKKEI